MKKGIVFLLLFLVGLTSFPDFSDAEKITQRDQSIVQPRADIYKWLYKTENGRLYKRKYNTTKERWEGPWILV